LEIASRIQFRVREAKKQGFVAHPHVRSTRALWSRPAASMPTLLHRLERFWTDQIIYRL
jgi:hypothetical protein